MHLRRLVPSLLLCAPLLHAQESLDKILSPSFLPYLRESTLIQVSSHDTSGGNADFVVVGPGKTATLARIEGPGVIVNIWMTISSPDPYFLRRILLRMYWDGEENPSVEAPVGDFFGTGFSYKHFVTPFIGMSSGGYYCYFPMPFNRSARIEVLNETGDEVKAFYYHLAYHKLSHPLEKDVAYFHAEWKRTLRAERGTNYTVLEARGEGHFAGVVMSMQSYENGLQFLEGDEMVYVDGEKQPSLYGTGTEDYFNSGWYFNRGEFSAPYHGLILKDDSAGRIAAYRFHVLDAIPFRKSIRFTIEHGHDNEERADYSSTAFWYQREPHLPFPPAAPAPQRIPLRVAVPGGALEAESCAVLETRLESSIEEMTPYGPDWSGMRQLKVLAGTAGDHFALALPAAEEEYDVTLYSTEGPDCGRLSIASEGRVLGELKGYSHDIRPRGGILLKGVRSVGGKILLQFDVTGKEPASRGYNVGLDAFVLKPRLEFIREWSVIGPFPNPRDSAGNRLGIDLVYPPEKRIDLAAAYEGVEGQSVRWAPVRAREDGFVELYGFKPNELVVVYALSYVLSPTEQTLPLLLGSDDGVKVFLNGTPVHRVLTLRGAEPDQDRVPLHLARGWNALLLKVENNYGGYGFYARVRDPSHTITVTPTRVD